ncbi:MAG: pyruvate kinase [Bacteroidetes bacterium]|nr:pyruvate kinase [Bacteroidota bacterium]MBS1683110.1 pyruvate kinase [Bacteroidota bacterium]
MNVKINKTKIVATWGPACEDENVMLEMIQAGVDVFRFNFSHGKHEKHLEGFQKVRKICDEHGLNIGILADLQGPKIRLGLVRDNLEVLETGSEIEITTENCLSTFKKIFISYENLALEAEPGDAILIDDGRVELKVLTTDRKSLLTARVVVGGKISNNKGVNLPDTKTKVPALTEKDRRDLDFALANGANWIALSFVRSPKDVEELKSIVGERNSYIKVMAKIEKPEALVEIDKIIEAADGIMIARGDLAVEVPQEKMPLIQKDIVKRCIRKAKPVVVATQMMDSMIESPNPTRAEITDVANAVIDGADAVMLSGESSMGKYPVRVIQIMEKILNNVESFDDLIYNKQLIPDKESASFLSDAICYNAARMSSELGARAIIGMTFSGYTGFLLSSYRPKAEVFIFTENKALLNALCICWGVRAFHYDRFVGTDTTIRDVVRILKERELVKEGDMIVNIGSMPLAARGRANMMKVTVVE